MLYRINLDYFLDNVRRQLNELTHYLRSLWEGGGGFTAACGGGGEGHGSFLDGKGCLCIILAAVRFASQTPLLDLLYEYHNYEYHHYEYHHYEYHHYEYHHYVYQYIIGRRQKCLFLLDSRRVSGRSPLQIYSGTVYTGTSLDTVTS